MSKRPSASDHLGDQPQKLQKTANSKHSSPSSPPHPKSPAENGLSKLQSGGATNRLDNPYGRRGSVDAVNGPAKQLKIPTERLKTAFPEKNALFTSPSPISTHTRSSEMDITSGGSTPRSLAGSNQQPPAPIAPMSAPDSHSQTSPVGTLLGDFASRVLNAASLQAQRDMAQIQISRTLDELKRTNKFFPSFSALTEQKNQAISEASKVTAKMDLQLKEHLHARNGLIQALAVAIESKGKSGDAVQMEKIASELSEAKAQIAQRKSEAYGLTQQLKNLKEEVVALKQKDKERSPDKQDIDKANKRIRELEDDYKDAKKLIKDLEKAVDKREDNDIWRAIDKQEKIRQTVVKQEKTFEEDKRQLEERISYVRNDCAAYAKDTKDLKAKVASLQTGTDMANLKAKVLNMETALQQLKLDIYGLDSEKSKNLEVALLSMVAQQSKASESQTTTISSIAGDVSKFNDAVKNVAQRLGALETRATTNNDIDSLNEQLAKVTSRIAQLDNTITLHKQQLEATGLDVKGLQEDQEVKDRAVAELADQLRQDMDHLRVQLEAKVTELLSQPPSAGSVTAQSAGAVQFAQPRPVETNGFPFPHLATNGHAQGHQQAPVWFQNGVGASVQVQGGANMSALTELTARFDALCAAFQHLEERYNNISTQELYKGIVQALHERFPNAAMAMEEIKRIHTHLNTSHTAVSQLQRESQNTTRLATAASSNADEAKRNSTRAEDAVQKLKVEVQQSQATTSSLHETSNHILTRIDKAEQQMNELKTSKDDDNTAEDAEARKLLEALGIEVKKLEDDHIQLKETVTENGSKLRDVESKQAGMKDKVDGVRTDAAELVARVWARVDLVEERVGTLEAEVNDVEERVGTLETGQRRHGSLVRPFYEPRPFERRPTA